MTDLKRSGINQIISAVKAVCCILPLILATNVGATVLTFDGLGLESYDPIPQGYGDNVTSTGSGTGDYREGNGFTPNVQASYRTLQDFGDGDVTSSSMLYWDRNYGDLRDVAFSQSSDGVAELTLQAEAGYEVVLNGFDIGGWFRADITGEALRIYNGDYSTVLYEQDPLFVDGGGPGNSGNHSTFTVNVSAPEIHIQWGRNWNIGIDNIGFDQRPVATGPAYCDDVTAIFCDDFERSELGPDWSVDYEGGTAGISSQTAQSPIRSMFTAGGRVTVTSRTFDLSSYESATLDYWWRRGSDAFSESPEGNEDLEVEYLDNNGNWQAIQIFTGNGRDGESGTDNFALPASALHDAFRIRFRQTAGTRSGFDFWHVDDVVLRGAKATNQPFLMEAGSVEAPGASATTVSFQQIYPSPPAVFVLGDDGNPEPSAVRVSQVTSTGFTLFPAEPPSAYEDQPDPPTKVHYLVVSYGQHRFPDGTRLEVGKVAVSDRQGSRIGGTDWSSIAFQTGFDATPALVSTLQTTRNETQAPADNATPWITVAHSDLQANGVRLALERAETSNGSVTQAEDVAYLAIETGPINAFADNSGSIVLGEAQLTGTSVTGTEACDSYGFLQAYGGPPLVVGSQLSRNGNNGGWLRRCNVTATNVSLKIEEDWANDRDLTHVQEQTGFLAFSGNFARDFTLRGFYALEGPDWTGAAGEVVEGLGSGRDGQARNGAEAEPAKVCYGASLGGGAYVNVGHYPEYSFADELTVMAWVKTDSVPGSDLKTIISKDENYEFHINSSGEINWWWQTSNGATRQFNSTGFTITPGVWTHVAVVYSRASGTQEIVVNGVTQASQSFTGESLRQNTDPLQIGADQGLGGRAFDGQIDEVRLYGRALSNAAIQREMGRSRACAATLDHFEVTAASTTASVCRPVPVTIRAKDAGNNTLSDYTGSINLSTSANHGNWQAITANGILTPQPDSDDNGQARYSFVDSDNGEIVLGLSNERADSLTVSAVDADGGQSGTSSVINFRENAIVISYNDSFNDDVVAYRNHDLQAEVLRLDPSTGECGPVTAYDGPIDLRAWLSRQPDDPGGVAPAVSAGAGTLDPVPDSRPSSTNLTVQFDEGQADLTWITEDVGHYALQLEDSESGLVVDETGAPLTISGTGPVMSVRPFGMALSVTGNPGATSPNGAAFRAAGRPFSVQARAAGYQGTDDVNKDGQPDGHGNTTPGDNADLSDNPSTEAFDGAISVSGYLVEGPPGYSDPGLAGLSGLSGFSSGRASGEARYNEVGIIELASDFSGSYLGRSISLVGRSGHVGRFHPGFFDVTVLSNGSLMPYCNGMSYTGQSISLGGNAEARITPRAYAASGAPPVTRNYRRSWQRLAIADVARTDPTQDLNQVGANGTPVTLSYEQAPPALVPNGDGTMDYQLGADSVTYGRNDNALIAAFEAELEVLLTKIDDGDAAAPAAQLPVRFLPLGHPIRYGRLRLDNAYGPETENLVVPATVEIWDGSRFVRNVDETCWAYTTGSAIVSGEPPETSVIPRSGKMVLGQPEETAQLELVAPGLQNTGEVNITWPVPGYWRVDADRDGSRDDLPEALATFGVYRGNDRIIYWQEVLN
jgi:MSHA biogenesis protein MshQ